MESSDDDGEAEDDEGMFDGWEDGGEEEDSGTDKEADEIDEDAHRRMLDAVRGKGEAKRENVVMSEAYPEDEFNLNPDSSTAGGHAALFLFVAGRKLTGKRYAIAVRRRPGFPQHW